MKKRRLKAGHRSWSAKNKPVPGQHVGDFLDPATRSRVMAQIKGKNTKPELQIAAKLSALSLSFEQHVRGLPGRPDFVFHDVKVVVFVDGDFWHGWRLPLWKHKLSPKWALKISQTRERDQRNFRKLRRQGWQVLRIWEHQIDSSVEQCVARILDAIKVK